MGKAVLYCGRQDCSDMHSFGPAMRSIYILHYVARGSGYFEVNKKKYRVEQGESFFIRPFEEVRYYPDPSDPWEYMWIDFDIPEFIEFSKKIRFSCDECIIGRIEKEKIVPLFEELFKRYIFGKTPISCYSLAFSILATYVDAFGVEEIEPKDKELFSLAKRMIKEKYHLSEFCIDDICKGLGVSRSTLHRSFVKNANVSPNRFLVLYRINKAEEMLKRLTSVKKAAFSCGFSDAYYFSNVFKRVKGVSPSEFKKAIDLSKES